MAARSNNWGNDGASWDERNWDAVQKQEQKKQDVLVMASQNSESIRRMVRQVDQTRSVAGETLSTLDLQSGADPYRQPCPPPPCVALLVLPGSMLTVAGGHRTTQAHARGGRQGRGEPELRRPHHPRNGVDVGVDEELRVQGHCGRQGSPAVGSRVEPS